MSAQDLIISVSQIIVDTGPIVAIFSASDRHHQACVETSQFILT